MAFFKSFSKKKKETLESNNSNIENLEIIKKDKNILTEKRNTETIEKGFFSKFKKGLSKTKEKFNSSLSDIFLGKKYIDEELLDDLECKLLMADVGVDAVLDIMDDVRDLVDRGELQTLDGLIKLLKSKLLDILTKNDNSDLDFNLNTKDKTPFVLLMVGINGAGKTTTIGKLAKLLQNQKKSVILAAGDTFRAAAVEQLTVWGERNKIPVISQHTGSDSASVIFDAVQSAKSKNIDVVIADTAGRLHTKDNLMQELKKIARVINKVDNTAPHEIMLVLDATTGQNAVQQAIEFNKTVEITGITLTKMDGTAKGGVIFAIANKLNIPIRYIGLGEKIEDLQEFNPKEFVDELFSE